MSEVDELSKEINNILYEVCEHLKWKTYEIDSAVDNQRGNGFMGDFFFASITNIESKQKLNLGIKKAFKHPNRREALHSREAFLNEIYFYKTVFPLLDKFQRGKNVENPFDSIPKYIYSDSTEFKECIVLENITKLGYEMFDKRKLLDEEHMKVIFEHYGRFHALSFALKDQKPSEYQIISDIKNVITLFLNDEGFLKMVEDTVRESVECCDKEVKDYAQSFKDNVINIFKDSLVYKGNYNCLAHGDCWSNNMMFKYKNSKLDSIKLLDFQIQLNTSPVHDLAYCFYAGASKTVFDKLDEYLQIYYDSFSKSARELGSDPTVIYPFGEIKKDWKIYSTFGICMSLIHARTKHYDKNQCQDLTDDTKENFTVEDLVNGYIDVTLFQGRVKDILRHVYDKDLLK